MMAPYPHPTSPAHIPLISYVCAPQNQYTTISQVFDNEWHHLIFRVHHAPSNHLHVNLDGVTMTMLYHRCQSPCEFLPFTQWVCIGASNVRGREVKHHYKGCLRDIRVMHSGRILAAHWPLMEGMGARMLLETSGNGHHAVPHEGTAQTTSWQNVYLPMILDSEYREMEDKEPTLEPAKKYKNNDVKLSYVQVRSRPSGGHGEVQFFSSNAGTGRPRDALEGRGGGVPPLGAPSLCPATVPLTSASFNWHLQPAVTAPNRFANRFQLPI